MNVVKITLSSIIDEFENVLFGLINLRFFLIIS